MANITVMIEGDVDEVVAALRGMAGGRRGAAVPAEARAPAIAPVVAEAEEPAEAAMEAAAAPAPLPEARAPEPEMAAWTASYASSFWQHLSDTARQAMLRVSRSPNHTQQRAQLMHTLRLSSQRELSGSLSSQGHSLNRLKRQREVTLPKPLTYDKAEDAYVLDANFAGALRELGMN